MANEKQFRYDPEADDETNAKKYRLPFALCKARGIAIQDWWTPRDAWKALENDGAIASVSKEYEDYYRELKKKRAAERRKERAPREAIRRAQRKDPEHNPESSYQHKDGFIAGVKKGAPMTFEQADSGRVNPYYGSQQIGYKTNCQTCVAVYIARRQGYNVRALPNLDNKNIFQLSYNPMLAYVDVNGIHPHGKQKKGGERTVNFLEQNIQDDHVYSISCTWAGRSSGHIVTAERREGKVIVYDPQTNMQYAGKKISDFFRNGKYIELTDLTDCRIDERFCDSIMKEARQK